MKFLKAIATLLMGGVFVMAEAQNSLAKRCIMLLRLLGFDIRQSIRLTNGVDQ